MINLLNNLGIDCRPIVAGNFAANKVCDYFDYSIHGNLVNADYVSENGLFIGNQHYDITKQIQIFYDAIT